jgi:hypothetical protein
MNLRRLLCVFGRHSLVETLREVHSGATFIFSQCSVCGKKIHTVK